MEGIAVYSSLAVAIVCGLWGLFKYYQKSIATVFKRFDDYKNASKKEFVNKDVCKVIHENNDRQFKEIKESLEGVGRDIKELLRRNRE